MSSLLEKPDQILYTVDEKPPLGTTLLLAVTHVALIFDAVVFIPNVLGKVTRIPAEQIRFVCFVTILVSALGSFLQIFRWNRFGTGFILFMGSYSAFLSCCIDAANAGGLALVASLTLLTAPVVFLFANFFKLLRHIVTPAVGGVVIILVAINLIPIGIELWHGGNHAHSGFGSASNYIVGVITMVLLLVLMLFGSRIVRLWTPMLAMGGGYLASYALGIQDFTQISQVAWIGLPHWAWPGLTLDFKPDHLPLAAAFIMAALAGSIEGTGNIMLVQSVSRRDKTISYQRVQSGLYCDGLVKIVSGLFGGVPISTYCDNIPLIEMTGVASRNVGIWGAGILGLLAFVPKAGAVILDMPAPVMGGMLISVAAMLFYAGIGMVAENGLNTQTGLMVGISVIVAMIAKAETFFPEIMPVKLAPLLKNGVAMGGFTAFIISTLIHILPRNRISFAVPAVAESLPEIVGALRGNQARLKMTDAARHRAELALEEVFMHLISKRENAEHTSQLQNLQLYGLAMAQSRHLPQR
jgi:NCS2 family nucleobase:cation symporter-2/xanthine permease XanP